MENYFREFMDKFRWNLIGVTIEYAGRYFLWFAIILAVLSVSVGNIDLNCYILDLALFIVGLLTCGLGHFASMKSKRKKKIIENKIYKRYRILKGSVLTDHKLYTMKSDDMLNYATILVASDESREDDNFLGEWKYLNRNLFKINTDTNDEDELFRALNFLYYAEADQIMEKIFTKIENINDLVYETNFGKCSLLHIAVVEIEWSGSEIIDYLLELGADVNIPNSLGWTPLHLAILLGQGRLAKYLLRRGADLKKENEIGIKAIDLAGPDLLNIPKSSGLFVCQGSLIKVI